MKSAAVCLRALGAGVLLAASLFWSLIGSGQGMARAQSDDPSPPSQVTKLIFIHHSCGENWLTDGYGNLGRVLGENNYFVSDTNYGWGPDAIGDRTDIINWPEWFRGQQSERYLAALYAESGQNSNYTRTLSDPGGENEIVMFKSCFPNSDMWGNPDDPPAPGEDLTVSNAKYIYNDLLNYFASRPDKLFVAITAPPMQYIEHPENARAFDTWLVQEWLAENNYTQNNVVVFDFYNVLTHPDNHHRFQGGQIEYITSHGDSTLYYDSDGDDHPSEAGSQKATDEFVPLLNVFYHRWKSGAPAQPPASAETEAPAVSETEPPPVAAAPLESDLIDDFESGPPANTDGWVAYWDEATQTTITCSPESGQAYDGSASLHIDFNLPQETWATCVLGYWEIRDWSSMQAYSFYMHADQPGLIFDVHAYGGTVDEWDAYYITMETNQEMVDGWAYVEIPWSQLIRAEWEDSSGAPFNPSEAVGLGFGFGTYNNEPGSGEIWVDEFRLVGGLPAVSEPLPAKPETEPPPVVEATAPAAEPTEAVIAPADEPEEEGGARIRLCPSPIAVGILVAAGAFWSHRRRVAV